MPLPDAARRLEGIAAGLGLVLEPTMQARLLRYLELLEQWNATYNLTAVREPAQMLTQHIADCLAVVQPLRRYLRDGEAAILDAGSGGGLPGVVLAVTMREARVTCVDSVGKKAAFVRQVAAELALGSLASRHARVEELRERFDIVISRAFASLGDFCRLTAGCLAPGGVWVAMKGQRPDAEIGDLPRDVEVFHVEHLVVPGLDAQRHLVWMRPASASSQTALPSR